MKYENEEMLKDQSNQIKHSINILYTNQIKNKKKKYVLYRTRMFRISPFIVQTFFSVTFIGHVIRL